MKAHLDQTDTGPSSPAQPPRPSPSRGLRISLWRLAFCLAVAAAFVAPRWVYWHHLALNPDAMTYWSVGRSLAHHQGWTWPIKPYFFPDNGKTIQPAVGYVSLPFTLLVGAMVSSGLDFRSASALNGLVGLIDSCLVYWLARLVCSRPLAALASLLFLVQPTVAESTTTLWTEPTTLAFVVGAYLVAGQIWSGDRTVVRVPWMVCGILLGMACLTRPASVVHLASIVIASLATWPRRTGLSAQDPPSPTPVGPFSAFKTAFYDHMVTPNRPAVLLLAAGAGISVVPYWIANRLLNGSPFFTLYQLLERHLFYGESMYMGFNEHSTSTATFIRTHTSLIVCQVSRNWHLCHDLLTADACLGLLVRSLLWVGITLLALYCLSRAPSPLPQFLRLVKPSTHPPHAIGGLISTNSGAPNRFIRTLTASKCCASLHPTPLLLSMVLGGIMNVAFTCAAWSTHEEDRFVLVSWILFLIVLMACFEMLATLHFLRSTPLSICPIILAIAAGIQVIRLDLTATSAAQEISFPHQQPSWREVQVRRYKPYCDEIRAASQPATVVAATDPWMVNFLCDRPTVLLPALRPGELPLFLRRYRPVWILADPDRMPDRDEDDDFSGMARSHWSERDWTTHSLDHVPYLKDESPVVADSRAHLYRVLSTPAEPAHPGTQTPAPLSHP